MLIARFSIRFSVSVFFLTYFVTVFGADDIPSKWAASPHADASSESFTHWNDEGKIPANCAACHSSSGFLEFLGEDGSTAGKTEKEHPLGSVIDCNACHNDATKTLTSVAFPSGATVEGIDSSAQCLVCHQGRSSTPNVNDKLGNLGDDEVSSNLAFINIHYRAAAATLYGTEVKGGYEYPGNTYSGKFNHVPNLNSCSGCHDPHSLKVKGDQCGACHQEKILESIRMSTEDFDGDGDTTEGIAAEIDALHIALGGALVAYAEGVAGSPMVYDAKNYPYFFIDTNRNLQADDDETEFPNRYQSWTPRLLKAAYNYQFVGKDPGGYAHNPSYLLQLMYDSLADLKDKIELDMSAIVRP